MELVIVSYHDGQWKDPWGLPHRVHVLDDAVLVRQHPTKVYRHHNGYTAKNYNVFEADDGRLWARIHPIDFGGRTYYAPILSPVSGPPHEGLYYAFDRSGQLMLADLTPIINEEQLRRYV